MTMLLMQTGDDAGDDVVNMDDKVKSTLTDINNKLQNPYEEDKVKDQIDNSVENNKDPRF